MIDPESSSDSVPLLIILAGYGLRFIFAVMKPKDEYNLAEWYWDLSYFKYCNSSTHYNMRNVASGGFWSTVGPFFLLL